MLLGKTPYPAILMLMALINASNSIASQPKTARIFKTKVELALLKSALEMYKLDTGSYPGAQQGLLALVETGIGKHWCSKLAQRFLP